MEQMQAPAIGIGEEGGGGAVGRRRGVLARLVGERQEQADQPVGDQVGGLLEAEPLAGASGALHMEAVTGVAVELL